MRSKREVPILTNRKFYVIIKNILIGSKSMLQPLKISRKLVLKVLDSQSKTNFFLYFRKKIRKAPIFGQNFFFVAKYLLVGILRQVWLFESFSKLVFNIFSS